MTRPVPSLTRAGKATRNAWLEGRKNWPLVAGWAESGQAAPALSQAWEGDHTGTVVTAWGGRALAGASPLLCCPR